MDNFPKPVNDKERLEALRSLEILDTVNEKDFDDIVALASRICGTPISMISLIDEDRQWFKAKIGTDETETHRRLSFCSHAILQNDILVVHDATTDVRFKDNELVTGEPAIRFYAGAQLVTDNGFKLGTLCVIDTQPKQLSWAEGESLRTLANVVVRLITLRLKEKQLSSLNEQLEFRSLELGQLGFSQALLVASMNEHLGKTLDSIDTKGEQHTIRIARDFLSLAADWVALQKANTEEKPFTLAGLIVTTVNDYTKYYAPPNTFVLEDIPAGIVVNTETAGYSFIISNLVKFLLLSLDKTAVEAIANENSDEIIVSFLQSKGGFFQSYSDALDLISFDGETVIPYPELTILFNMVKTVGGSLRIEKYKQEGAVLNLAIKK